MSLFADAYATGSAFGTAARWIVLALVAVALVRKVLAGRATAGTHIGLAAVVALLGVSAYLDLGRGESAASALQADQGRIDFVAGCVDSGAAAAYCGCIYDELQKAGIDTEEEAAALARQRQDGSIPAPIAAAAQACA